jgi:hypothetical protein
VAPHRSIASRATLFGCLAGFVYLLIAGSFRFEYTQSWFAHHVLMADAMLHGELAIRDEAFQRVLTRAEADADLRLERIGQTMTIPEREAWRRERLERTVLQDWSVHEGRRYGYWAPLMPVVMIPFVWALGLDVSDALVSCLAGALNVALFYVLLRRADRRGVCALDEGACTGLTLLFAFGTVHFYLACAGLVWFTAQILTTTAILGAAVAVLSEENRIRDVALAGVLFGLALLGRNVAVLLALFFVATIWIRTAEEPDRARAFGRRIAAFGAPIVVALSIQAAYNAARFGSVWNDGLAIQIQTTGDPVLRERYLAHGMFDLRYFADNLRVYFANFRLPRDASGRLTYDPAGQSLFLVTPPILFAFLAWRKRTPFTGALVLGVAPFLVALLLYFASGYAQFGNRYLLEAMPFLLLLAATGMGPHVGFTAYAAIVLAIAVNTFGTYRFCERYFARIDGWIPAWSLAACVLASLLVRVAADRRGAMREVT